MFPEWFSAISNLKAFPENFIRITHGREGE
jgi:hypothetical protein